MLPGKHLEASGKAPSERANLRTVKYGVGSRQRRMWSWWCVCVPNKVTKLSVLPSLRCGGIAPNAPWRP
eukprot:1770689-Prymnesium_polylepis.1